MKKKRPISDAEKKPHESSIVGLGGREFQRNVSEKVGADGVIETHIGYEPTKNSGFRKAGAGKGDRMRHVNKQKFDENYRRIFGHD